MWGNFQLKFNLSSAERGSGDWDKLEQEEARMMKSERERVLADYFEEQIYQVIVDNVH